MAGFWVKGLEVGFDVVDMGCGGWAGGVAPGGCANHDVVGDVADQEVGYFFEAVGQEEVFVDSDVVIASGYSPVDDVFNIASMATCEGNYIKLLTPDNKRTIRWRRDLKSLRIIADFLGVSCPANTVEAPGNHNRNCFSISTSIDLRNNEIIRGVLGIGINR